MATRKRDHGWRRFLAVDPVPPLLACGVDAIVWFARRDLLEEPVEDPAARLWKSAAAERIVRRQNRDGSWSYPAPGKLRKREDYDQLETFRQVAILVEKHAMTREHPALARAAEWLFARQTSAGDFRGIYAREYATPYVGAIMELLIKAGYGDDARIARTFRWLESVRQRDGGWAIPWRTAGLRLDQAITMTKTRRAPIEPDASKPSSHLVTGMVLRAYAAHAAERKSATALAAGRLLASRLLQRDTYADRRDPSYWGKVGFPFWFTDVVSALDSLSLVGITGDDDGDAGDRIRAALDFVRERQRADGTFSVKLLRDSDGALPAWIMLAVARVTKRLRATPSRAGASRGSTSRRRASPSAPRGRG